MKKKIRPGLKMKKKSALLKEAEQVFKASHVAVIFEDVRDSIKLLAENLAGNNERIDRLEGRFDSFQNEMCSFQGEMYSFRDEMYEFRNLALEEFDKINTRLFKIEYEIGEINKKLDQKVDKKWAIKKITILEKQIQLIKEKVGLM